MTTGVPIVKTNGTGNEFVLVDARIAPLDDPVAFAREICGERGVGADGLLLLQPSERFDARLRIINSDGSEAEMCGNAVRCVGKYVYDHGHVRKPTLTISKLSGCLYRLSRSARKSPMPSMTDCVSAASVSSRMAWTRCPNSGSGRPTTTQERTSRCATTAASTSAG